VFRCPIRLPDKGEWLGSAAFFGLICSCIGAGDRLRANGGL